MLKPESNFVCIDKCLWFIFIGYCRSTFLKQMKFQHGRGFSLEEKLRLIPFINQQIIDIIRCICLAMKTLEIPYENPESEVRISLVLLRNKRSVCRNMLEY